MTSQSQLKGPEHNTQRQQVDKVNNVVERADNFDPSINVSEISLSQLNDNRFPIAQRQSMAVYIGQVAGNQHLQRILKRQPLTASPPLKAVSTDMSTKSADSVSEEAKLETPESKKRKLAESLTSIGGSAGKSDMDVVIEELMKLPIEALMKLSSKKRKIIVCRNAITEVATYLKGVKPRGWAEGSTWDSVPGIYEKDKNRVIIATRGGSVPSTGNGHGTSNLVLHEVGHALDEATGGSDEAAFKKARTNDMSNLNTYQKQKDKAGREETFADSFANYYEGSPRSAVTPNLHQFWKTFKWK